MSIHVDLTCKVLMKSMGLGFQRFDRRQQIYFPFKINDKNIEK